MKKKNRNTLIKLGGVGLQIYFLIFFVLGACSSPEKQASMFVKQASMSIKEHRFDSVFIDSTVFKIWQIIGQEFQGNNYKGNKYNCNVSLFELKHKLPDAIISGQPFIVTFAPSIVEGIGEWRWTTVFWELSGQHTTLDYMTPNIYTTHLLGDKEIWQYDNYKGGIPIKVDIDAYSKGSYEWWCSGDFYGFDVILNFEFGADSVKSYTSLETIYPDSIKSIINMQRSQLRSYSDSLMKSYLEDSLPSK